MSITVSQLLDDFNKYALLSHNESVVVTDNGQPITVLYSPFESKLDTINRLAGMFNTNVSIDDIRVERSNQL